VVFKTTAIDHSAIPPRRNQARIRVLSLASALVVAVCHRKCNDRQRNGTTQDGREPFYPLRPARELSTHVWRSNGGTPDSREMSDEGGMQEAATRGADGTARIPEKAAREGIAASERSRRLRLDAGSPSANKCR
jgi:hypothetical protein